MKGEATTRILNHLGDPKQPKKMPRPPKKQSMVAYRQTKSSKDRDPRMVSSIIFLVSTNDIVLMLKVFVGGFIFAANIIHFVVDGQAFSCEHRNAWCATEKP